MISKRLIHIIVLTIIPLSAFADKVMTVENIDTGESFEVTVPDRLKITQYNTNWLDSVPYLIENARWHEPWAYKALAECYRFGKGGLKKSIFNAMVCYEVGGLSPAEIAKAAYDANPYDEMGLLDHIMERIDKKSISDEEIIGIIDDIPDTKPKWANLIKNTISTDKAERTAFIEANMSKEMTSDELLVCFFFLSQQGNESILNSHANIKDEYREIIKLLGENMPILYDIFGEKLWRKHNEDLENSEKYIEFALECMHHADQAGFLSNTNIRHILSYYKEHGRDSITMFSEADLDRFNRLCSDEYSDDVEEDGIVEVDDCPVELIED